MASNGNETRENARNSISQYVCQAFDVSQHNLTKTLPLFADKCELKDLFSKISGIPEENIEYVKLQLRDPVSILQIHNALQWTSTPNWSDDYSSSTTFQDGDVLYYRLVPLLFWHVISLSYSLYSRQGQNRTTGGVDSRRAQGTHQKGHSQQFDLLTA